MKHYRVSLRVEHYRVRQGKAGCGREGLGMKWV